MALIQLIFEMFSSDGLRPQGAENNTGCAGNFLAKGKPDWVPFVTVKTSGYEQWLGDQAASFCKSPPMIWESGDLSSSLQSRFESLR